MEEQINLYTEKIFNELMFWKKELDITRRSHFGDIGLKNHIRKIVKGICENNKQYLLTDDVIHYITYKSFMEHEYDIKLLQSLGNFKNIEYKSVVSFMESYYYSIFYSHIPHDKARRDLMISQYINRMDDDTKHIVSNLKNGLDTIRDFNQLSYKSYYSFFADYLLKKAVSSVLMHDKEAYEKIIEKYLKDPFYTLERFKLNGIIDYFDKNRQNAIDFIEEDLNSSKQAVIRR